MSYKKEEPCTKPFLGCALCGGGEMHRDDDIITASLSTRLYQGMGGWEILKDNEVIHTPEFDLEWEDYYTLEKFEKLAVVDPDHDWRAVLNLPLRDAVYQRQGVGKWVLISSGKGFA